MDNDKVTFLKGIENLKAVGDEKQFSFSSSLKIFLFYLYLSLLAKKNSSSSEVFFINGQVEAKKDNPSKQYTQRIYARKFTNTISELKNEVSIVSIIPRGKRLKTIVKAITNRPGGRYSLGRWLEFLLIKEAFIHSDFRTVSSFGHYDEFTFWITEFCRQKSIHYSMYQHGIVLEKIVVPNRIYCNEMHVFDKYSELVFRNIISNEDCAYRIEGFKSGIIFKQIDREVGRKYIGIVDQTFPEWTSYVTACVSKLGDYTAVVMLHPLSKDNIIKNSENIIVTRDKYINLDCVISDFSTLVLDFIYSGFQGKIVCTQKEACESIFGEYDVEYLDLKEISEKLPLII